MPVPLRMGMVKGSGACRVYQRYARRHEEPQKQQTGDRSLLMYYRGTIMYAPMRSLFGFSNFFCIFINYSYSFLNIPTKLEIILFIISIIVLKISLLLYKSIKKFFTKGICHNKKHTNINITIKAKSVR